MAVVLLQSTSGNTYSSRPGDRIVVAGDVIWSGGGDGIQIDDFDVTLTVDGEVYGGDDGVEVAVSGADIVVGITGTVRGLGGRPDGSGIDVVTFAAGLEVLNFGEISGAIGVDAGLGRDARIVNEGVISGLEAAVLLGSDGTLVNGGSVISQSRTGVLLQSGQVRNSGDIAASAREATAIKFIGDEDDSVVNAGGILGDILLGEGDDRYQGRDGRLEGAVKGQEGDDELHGGGDHDRLFGGEGRDQVSGRGDDDTVGGGGGADVLKGGDGDDALTGHRGSDRLNGGRSDDSLTGDSGDDVFAFAIHAGDDTITDFRNGQDLIDLTAFGLRPNQFAEVRAALSNAGGGTTRLDLGELGGGGSVLIEGLSFGEAGASDFLL